MNRYGFKKTMFSHLILSYTILSVVLIGAMGGYWYTQASRMMDQEIAKDNITRLNAIQTFIEQTLLKKYEDNLQNKALSINFIQSNGNLSMLLYGDWKGNMSRVASFNDDLEFFKVENTDITNVAVYFPGNDYVIDADKFYMNTAYSPESEFYLKYWPDAFEKMDGPDQRIWRTGHQLYHQASLSNTKCKGRRLFCHRCGRQLYANNRGSDDEFHR